MDTIKRLKSKHPSAIHTVNSLAYIYGTDVADKGKEANEVANTHFQWANNEEDPDKFVAELKDKRNWTACFIRGL